MSTVLNEAALIKELAFEANTPYINAAYRSGLVVSWLTVLRCLLESLRRRSGDAVEDYADRPGIALAMSIFKNERVAIDEHISQEGCDWRHVRVDPNRGMGLHFATALLGASLALPVFVWRLVRAYGWSSLRRSAYPFIGFAVYRHLRQVFGRYPGNGTLVTANMAHPLALAAHYAARAAGWQTVYIEHAMTPRSIARDMGHSQLWVRSAHTRQLLCDCGIAATRIGVLGYWKLTAMSASTMAAGAQRVGFAVNDLDDYDCIAYLTERLTGAGMRCEIRVHDADRRLEAFRGLGARLGVAISSAADSGIADFVRRHDVIIVGNSSVLLDCARVGIPAIYFWNGAPELYDYYGLAQYMSYPTARTPDELLSMLVVS